MSFDVHTFQHYNLNCDSEKKRNFSFFLNFKHHFQATGLVFIVWEDREIKKHYSS